MAKVLIIEDSPFYRKAISAEIEREGYEVYSASTGEEGVRIARVELPAVILLDMLLPRLDGMMVLRILRSSPETKSIPIIVMSGSKRAEDVQAAKALNVVDYYDKGSINSGRLLSSIKNVLSQPQV